MKWIIMESSQRDYIFKGGNGLVAQYLDIVTEPRYVNGIRYGLSDRPFKGWNFYNTTAGWGGRCRLYYDNANYIQRSFAGPFDTSYGWMLGKLVGIPDSVNYPTSTNWNEAYTILQSNNITGTREFNINITAVNYHDWTQPVNFKCGDNYYIGVKFYPYKQNKTSQTFDRIIFIRDTGGELVEDIVIENGVWNDDYSPIIEFGNSPQNVCEEFYEWYMNNTHLPRTAKIIIHGSRDYATQWLEPYSSLKLSVIGNTCTITTSESETYSFPVSNKFTGLSLHSVAIIADIQADGLVHPFSSNDVVEMWMVEQETPPTPSTFAIKTYKYTGKSNVVDKTLPTEVIYNITLKDDCDLINPVFLLEIDDVPDFNYIYCPTFGRYYYVTGIISHRNKIWRISCHCDVLMSYKNQILANSGFVNRNETVFDSSLPDPLLQFNNNTTFDVIPITVSNPMFHTEPQEYDAYSVILIGRK